MILKLSHNKIRSIFFLWKLWKNTKTKYLEEIDIPGLGTEDRIINQNPTWNNEQVRDPFNRPAARTGNFLLFIFFVVVLSNYNLTFQS